ncbi:MULTISPECIES: peroxiredoxin [unclassified Colwellia]|mgnify:FL=1|uniref:peroxiredoxin n=1 Tax=unclassified Colwellia TaxID=196834 RepID=UPI0015F695CD|nr:MULTISPECIES: peroxiredoxin [unclassified Colwellia]MBA6363721.1 peroxiredoxin [Colwellia sp. BRX8-8]MBA6348395.1 peroxiredoxin [Colwellia sp. BRX8-9]MBA6352620.1 peroxiredoxin [Colwellia sp. BRX9-1]MBA6355800.1 peroxiredoxin [Colwellia sp. BRX8-3]MBA6359453.1 peroxiredoxin [Colwellia sp. BRX8-6]
MIEENKPMPSGELSQLKDGNMITHNTDELFANKKVVLFAVPGAFTPTCSAAHLPGYVVSADELKAKGVDAIICLSVNDAFVMNAWGEAQNAENIMMLADGDGSYTKALGLSMETAGFGGLRSQRYAMVIENGTVTNLHIEKPKEFEVSTAESILKTL